MAAQANADDSRVAVVMITHNRRSEALRSLGHLVALPERPTIVVVDNASVDGTAEAIRARFPGDRVRVIESRRSLGGSAFVVDGGLWRLVFMRGEEEWLAVELAERGYWMCYVPELTVHHHPAGRDSHTRRWQGIRNTLWFLWLRRPLTSALRRTLHL